MKTVASYCVLFAVIASLTLNPLALPVTVTIAALALVSLTFFGCFMMATNFIAITNWTCDVIEGKEKAGPPQAMPVITEEHQPMAEVLKEIVTHFSPYEAKEMPKTQTFAFDVLTLDVGETSEVFTAFVAEPLVSLALKVSSPVMEDTVPVITEPILFVRDGKTGRRWNYRIARKEDMDAGVEMFKDDNGTMKKVGKRELAKLHS